MGSFELVEFHHLSQEFYRLDQPARESLYHGASSPGLPLPTATRDDRVEEIFFQDRHALFLPHIVAREVVPQLSLSCASSKTKAGFLLSVLAENLHQAAPPKAHPHSLLEASLASELSSINSVMTRGNLRHKYALIWDLNIASRWEKVASTTLSKLPCSSRSSFLCSEQTQWHCNGKKHLSLSHGCEKKDGDFSLGQEYVSDER